MNNCTEFFCKVEEILSNSFWKYGFRIIEKTIGKSFDNCSIVFESDSCKIKVFLDRGSVLMQITSKEFEKWELFDFVVDYLMNGVFFEEIIKKRKKYPEEISEQLEEIKTIFDKYADIVLQLFSKTNLSEIMKRIEEFGWQRTAKIYNKE